MLTRASSCDKPWALATTPEQGATTTWTKMAAAADRQPCPSWAEATIPLPPPPRPEAVAGGKSTPASRGRSSRSTVTEVWEDRPLPSPKQETLLKFEKNRICVMMYLSANTNFVLIAFTRRAQKNSSKCVQQPDGNHITSENSKTNVLFRASPITASLVTPPHHL